jgi:D-xylose transport system permease protein
MTATTAAPQATQSAPERVGLMASFQIYRNRIRTGDVGSLPAVLGLIALVILFSVLRPSTFTTAGNFANLINQGVAVMVISMGLIFVLLLGEIDLSAGFTAGTSGAILGVSITNHGWPWWAGILACLGSGTIIGLTIGSIVTRLGIPSFVVTLAGFLALQGVQLSIIGEGGTITINNKWIVAIDNNNLPVWLGWVFFVLVSVGYAGFGYWRILSRRRKGLSSLSLQVWALKSIILIVLLGVATAYLSKQRALNKAADIKGVPEVVILILVLLMGLTFLLVRTPFGRHVYAIGGNIEAARRAGINVVLVKTACFMICSTMAAVAGILYASRNNSISPTTGGGEDLLLAVGAAVIGGCSLFGGKGRVLDAVIGGLVVVVITNGMLLLGLADSSVEIFTGLVLLVAASVDALSRRRAAASGS